MNEFLTNLRREAEKNPIAAMAAAAALLASMGKMINSAAWHKEVNRRTKIAKKR